MYRCAKCNLAVIVIPDHEPIRACKCEAAIIAEMDSTLKGVGGVKVN